MYIILREVLPDFRLKVARVKIGLDRRRLNQSEENQLQMAESLDASSAQTIISSRNYSEGEHNHLTFYFVKSFINKDLGYVVSLDDESKICHCTCHYMTTSSSVCKHVFLAHRVYGHDLCFETRKGGSFEAEDFSVSSL